MKCADLNVWGKNSYIFDYVPWFFKKLAIKFSKHRTTWREGMWTGTGNHVLSGGYRVFLAGDRQTKCLGGDHQRTVWCLDQDQLYYLRVRQTWLSFEFTVFLCGVCNLTCILVSLNLQISSRTCTSKMWSCVLQDSGNHGRRLSSNDYPYHYL